ncbi:MotA/TolQ/ExbB proton channel family protein [Lignipirellula cremea]|uniref:Biopolymer transport protein ExbB n=1 Tax=Lignipirellula cremea TaxID=2528010 RepID=A0A518DSS8_9BACT|nr:MotA/TolQ/ExbB proton channel family protein [Lignipirellula cremea]QDU94893.1 Biopolymer transport protein ExbB [Lignipirellula cremea]
MWKLENLALWRRVAAPLFAAVALCTFLQMAGHQALFAQPAVDETLDVESGDPAAAPVTAPPAAAPASEGNKSFLEALLDAGVAWVLIFFGLSLLAVYFIVEHALTIRREKLMPEYVLGELEILIEAGQINEAIEFCLAPQNHCMASEVVLAGLERYQGSDFGFAEYKTAVEEEGENQTSRLYRRTEVLGVIGAISPMLGLTGTVLGMITAFNVIASTKGAAKPEELAGGIGQALVTTLLGLMVAIPCMVSYSWFRNLIDSIVAEAGKRIERILSPLGRQRK